MSEKQITAERIKELFTYDPQTGEFRWATKTNRKVVVGEIAGTASLGYRVLHIDGIKCRAHRVAWMVVYGEWPTEQIDHINGDRSDNRIANLRQVTNRVNQQNKRGPHRGNRAGFLGVVQVSKRSYMAQIVVNGKRKYLGCHSTPEIAHETYVAAKRQLHEGNTL